MALGRSCLLANTRRTASRSSSSLSILCNSSLASAALEEFRTVSFGGVSAMWKHCPDGPDRDSPRITQSVGGAPCELRCSPFRTLLIYLSHYSHNRPTPSLVSSPWVTSQLSAITLPRLCRLDSTTNVRHWAIWAFAQIPVPVVGVYNEDETLGVGEVMPPQRADLILPSHVPHGEGDVLVLDRLNVEADLPPEDKTQSESTASQGHNKPVG